MNLSLRRDLVLASLFVVTLLGGTRNTVEAQDVWLNWRGPNQNGTAPAGKYPIEWSEDTHIAWKRPLPERGASTPIVTKELILVTLGNLGRNCLVALDHQGNEAWRVDLGKERAGKHGKASGE